MWLTLKLSWIRLDLNLLLIMSKLGSASLFILKKAMATHSSTRAWKIPWMEEPGGLQSMGSLRVGHDWVTSCSLFHFHALEKEMATHSCVPAWRIPGAGEPGGLPSMGSRRVGYDWSNLAVAQCASISTFIMFHLSHNAARPPKQMQRKPRLSGEPDRMMLSFLALCPALFVAQRFNSFECSRHCTWVLLISSRSPHKGGFPWLFCVTYSPFTAVSLSLPLIFLHNLHR